MNDGNSKFQCESDPTLKMFESKQRKYNTFSFFGTRVTTFKSEIFTPAQLFYIAAVCTLPVCTL